MNREKAIRLFYYNLLSGQVIYDSNIVSVWDEKAEYGTNNLYILLKSQSASNQGNFDQHVWECDIELEIVSKQQDGISKDVTDDIGEQVEQLLYQAMQRGTTTNGWQITNFVLQTLNYDTFILSPTDSELSVTMVFRQTVTKETDY